ncbi:RNA polymerase sigma factor [Pedobacter psychroterrae]|uniref:RNA polymerase sigma-70 factor n=1 Tax=Pedobacter psychroterrae TaxID=2530453 RepID=A0A4V2ML18_9SPHI|nr:RNA polymerase sigma-70 factor [Pedobacter psychroterrae]TCD00317.1 RNA polymerase sigma-70 factor [Pedobacter psychroterrae]
MSGYNVLADLELYTLLKAGDKVAYTEIYNRYFSLLYLHALKRLRDEEAARDLIQDLFATLWLKREVLTTKTNLSNYLFTAVRNGVFNFIAHQKVASRYISELPDKVEPSECITDHLARERQLAALIEKEIGELPEKMREIFLLSRVEGLSHKEIGERLGISELTVKTQVKNALRILRGKLGVIIYFIFIYPHL